MTDTLQAMLKFLTTGGMFMWPLLVCSIVTVTTLVLATLMVPLEILYVP